MSRARGENERAAALLKEALEYAALSDARHLATRIHLWLAPLVPPDVARTHLQEAKQIASESSFAQLLQEVESLEQTLSIEL